MNTIKKSVSCVLLICVLIGCLCGCSGNPEPTEGTVAPSEEAETTEPAELEVVDYAGSLKLDMSSNTAKQEVTVKLFVDGDTTHFNVPTSIMDNGVLKARYMAINTPESTGKIEEYGKAASTFTKEKLSGASSIIIESETESWTPDSTGSRYLAWVWYKPKGSDEYRNLNIEILQNGLAIANSSANNRYGDICMAAINQAKAQKLNIYSGEPDPNFYYGDAVELTLKELRTNIENYSGMKVAFHGIITMHNSNTVYVEDLDPETGLYYGMAVYYGFNLNGQGLDILTVGNEVRIVGSVQYYEGGGTWQVSDLNYRLMQPDDPGNIQKISEGNTGAFVLTDPDTFLNGTVDIETEEGTKTFDYAQLVMNTSVEMKGLRVVDVYTTKNEDSASKGAMTLTCKVGSHTITVRTVVLYDEEGNLITQDAYLGKTIDVKGMVDYYNGDYQIKVFTADNITIIN